MHIVLRVHPDWLASQFPAPEALDGWGGAAR
jgi:hypothetical protein